nr:MAG TPA: hypothetical protein [Caudoviricetes sp.]
MASDLYKSLRFYFVFLCFLALIDNAKILYNFKV